MFRIKTTIETATGTSHSERIEPAHRINEAKRAEASAAKQGDSVTQTVTRV